MEKHKNAPVLWFTGLPSAGKSTLAYRLYQALKSKGIKCEILDGDILREKATAHLGFNKEDRLANIKIAGFLAQKLSENGIVVIAAFVSPYLKQREELKKQIKNFLEIFVNAPLEICQRRDVKGLYKKAKEGKIRLLTGVDDVYEKPPRPDLEIKTNELSVEEAFGKITKFLEKRYNFDV